MVIDRSLRLGTSFALSAVVALGTLPTGGPSEAAAAGGGCASHAEIENRLRDGMSLARVRRIVGAKGNVVERSAIELFLEFRPCNPNTHSKAYVQFDRPSRDARFRAWDFGFYWIQN